MRIITHLLLFVTFVCSSQSSRDIFIKDSVLSVLNTNRYEDISEYNLVKKNIEKLDSDYGYQVFLHRRLLEPSYLHKDLSSFKSNLTILVKDYGFDVAYMSGNENYYNAIIKGSLLQWFKAMYLKNHTVWLSNNFDKQQDLKALNTMHEKDQFMTSFAMNILNIPTLDSLQTAEIKKYIGQYHQKNIETLLYITKKLKAVPNEQNYATLQNGYTTLLIHNFQFKDNLEKDWNILFPYFKEAYLKHEITDVVFRNYDFYCYQHFGYQEFDSFIINQIPEQFRKNNNPILIKNPKWLQQLKKEFGWND